MTLATVALAAAPLWVAARGDGPGPRPQPAPPTADHVRMVVDGKELSGWPLDPDAEGGTALLLDDGTIVVVARAPAPKVVELEKRPVAEAPTDALVLGLAHAEEGVRDRCQQWIEQQGPKALPRLVLALDHDSVEARRRALLVLSDHPCVKLTAAVRARRSDRDDRVRELALRAYAALAPDDLYTTCVALLDAAREPSIAVRHEAIAQLGTHGDVRAVDPLLDRLVGCSDHSLRCATFDALRRLTSVNFRHDEEQWRAWWTNHRDEVLAGAKSSH